MKRNVLTACFGAWFLLGAGTTWAQSSAPPAPPLPPHETVAANLPKIYAIGIRCADMAKSIRFYREAMGASGAKVVTARETAISFASGSGINLVQAEPNSPPPGTGAVGFIFQTNDIDGLVARVKILGGAVVREPSDGSKSIGIRLAMITDPDGARIEVAQFPDR